MNKKVKAMSRSDVTWSYSQLSGDCNASWYMSKVLEKNKDVSNAFAQGGTFMHDLMECVGKGSMSWDEAHALFLDNWDNCFSYEYPAFAIDLKSHYKKKIDKNWFKPRKGLRGDTVSIEEHIEFSLPSGEKFQGYIDRVALVKDKLTIRDYKISNPKSFDVNEKQKQLLIYAYGYHQIHGKYTDELVFEFFQGGEKIIPFQEVWMEKTIQWAEDRIIDLKSRLVATQKLNAKGMFLPNYDKLLEDGKTGMMCNELCNHRFDCPFKKGDTLKIHKPLRNQDLKLSL